MIRRAFGTIWIRAGGSAAVVAVALFSSHRPAFAHGGGFASPPPPLPPTPPAPPPPPPPPPDPTPASPAPPPPDPTPALPATPPPTHPAPPITPGDPNAPPTPTGPTTPVPVPAHPPVTPGDPNAPPTPTPTPGGTHPTTPPSSPNPPPVPAAPTLPTTPPTTPGTPPSSAPVTPSDPPSGTASTGPDAPPPASGSAPTANPPTPTPAPTDTPLTGGAPGGTGGNGDGSSRLPPRSAEDGKGRGARRGVDSSDWRDWWNANAGALRAARPTKVRVTTESALAGIGGDGPAGPSVETPSARSIATLLVPTLRIVLATASPKHADTIAASTIALAKATDDPADALRITAALDDAHLADMDHEAAALALGCLRRTKPPAAFDGRFYDKLRATLFETIDDRRQARRTRCFAALALGLLGDQATDPGDVFAKDGRLVIRGLWLRLERPDTDDDMAVSMLVGLSLQNPRGVPSAVRDGLRRLAQSGDAGRRRRGSLPRAHALLALARLYDGHGVGLACAIVKSTNEDAHVRRSALLALGLLAPRMEGPDRESLAKTLLSHAKSGEPNTSGLALVSAARLLSAEFTEGRVSLQALQLVGSLVDIADHGAADVRPFAALAVGLVSRPIGRSVDDLGFVETRSKSLDRLRRIYADDGQDPILRGAFAVALGIAADTGARVLLEATVSSRRGSADVAAYACAGLGLLGEVPASTLGALRRALVDRSSEVLQREAARALGLLGDVRAVPMLVAEVERGGSDHLLARAILALGAIRDISSVGPLCALARRTQSNDLTRALACAGLGLLADLERIPSLSLLGVDSNYMARTEALHEALSLL